LTCKSNLLCFSLFW